MVLTTVSLLIFSQLRQRASTASSTFFANITTGKLSLLFLALGVAYAAVRRTLLIVYPPILSDGLFNFVVMQTLFYIPFFLIGALAFIHPRLKALFTTPPGVRWVLRWPLPPIFSISAMAAGTRGCMRQRA